jgi:ATP-binding cassette subfamily B protein
VLIDDVDLAKADLTEFLRHVAVVSQDCFLFNESIRENIRYGRLDASDAEVEEAAKAACIHDEILEKPDGYEALVGERGGNLSGGQIQRLAIARAMLKGPGVLVLDEATSALDTRTERKVQEALDALARSATTFIVAHRLSTVRQADQILVIDRGKLVERGTHDALIAEDGVYAGLVARQLEGDTQEERDA